MRIKVKGRESTLAKPRHVVFCGPQGSKFVRVGPGSCKYGSEEGLMCFTGYALHTPST